MDESAAMAHAVDPKTRAQSVNRSMVPLMRDADREVLLSSRSVFEIGNFTVIAFIVLSKKPQVKRHE